MYQFFALHQERLAQVAPITDDDIYADARDTRMPRWLNSKSLYLAQYPPHVLDQLEHLIRQAETCADADRPRDGCGCRMTSSISPDCWRKQS